MYGFPAASATVPLGPTPYERVATAVGNVGAASTVASSAYHGSASLLLIGRPVLAERVILKFNVQSGNFACSIYTSVGTLASARPSQLVATTGVVAVPASGSYQSVPLLQQRVVTPGMWVLTQVDNTTATIFVAHSNQAFVNWDWNPGSAFVIPDSMDGQSLVSDGRVFHIAIEGRPL